MTDLALVTGASSGIGRAFAERLAADGYDLIVTGRRRDRLEALAGSLPDVQVQVVPADLATDDGIGTIAERCASQPLTMLVNNAGLAHYMPLADLPAAQARELTQVKVAAPTMLTHAAVPGMLARGHGTVVNVAGMIAFAGPAPSAQLPRRAIYGGSLAYLVAMSQTLHAELAGTGVTVQVVCPGVVATEFHEVQGLDLSALPGCPPRTWWPRPWPGSNSARSSVRPASRTTACWRPYSPPTWPRSPVSARSLRPATGPPAAEPRPVPRPNLLPAADIDNSV